MKLRTRIAIILLLVVAVFVAATYLLQSKVVLQSFLRLETEDAENNILRCDEAVSREIKSLQDMANDWAFWDDAYAFMVDRNEAFLESNLQVDSILETQRLCLLYFVGLDGTVVWGHSWNADTGELMELPGFPPDRWPEAHVLLAHRTTQKNISGLVLTEQGVILVAASKVLPTNAAGESRGTMVMGRLLGEELRQSVKDQVKMQLDLWARSDADMPEEAQRVFGSIAPGEPRHMEDAGGKTLRVYRMRQDLWGKPALLMCATLPREISAQGGVALGVTLGALLAASAVMMFILGAFLELAIVQPLRRLTRLAAHIAHSEDLSQRLSLRDSSEVGQLARAFDGMLERLEADAKEREQLAQKLERLSLEDGLTGLANRRRFDAVIDAEWRRAMRHGQPIALLMIDIDYFKRYNDHYGHPGGDEVLRQVGQELALSARRAGELAARYGGEEFAIILPSKTVEEACADAERIRAGMETRAIAHEQSEAASHVTLSIGVASCVPARGQSWADLIAKADAALYQAKIYGRNRVELPPDTV